MLPYRYNFKGPFADIAKAVYYEGESTDMAVRRFEAYIQQSEEQVSDANFELEEFTKRNAKVVQEYKWMLSVRDTALRTGDEYRRQLKQV